VINMNYGDPFGLAIKSLYRYPELKYFLAQEEQNNDFKLSMINLLSRFYRNVCLATGIVLVMMVTIYLFSVLGLVIGINVIHLSINALFFLYLLILITILFLVIVATRMMIFQTLKHLVSKLEAHFTISPTETYISDRIKGNDIYFNMTSSDFKRIAQTDVKATISLNRASFNKNYSGNGLITEISSNSSAQKIYLQLKAIE